MNGSFSAESLCGSSPCRSLRKNQFQTSRSPSLPHAFSGNPGEFLTGPPIRAFGGDNFGTNSHTFLSNTLYLPQTMKNPNSIEPQQFAGILLVDLLLILNGCRDVVDDPNGFPDETITFFRIEGHVGPKQHMVRTEEC